MEGADYRQLVGGYIFHNFSNRGVKVYTEVHVGTTIIGKDRQVDLLVLCEGNPIPMVIEAKWQLVSGTADEKIPYALQDLAALRVPSCLAYAGPGFSRGVLNLLRGSKLGAYCYPNPENMKRGAVSRRDKGPSGRFQTWELDHALALTFGWWDVLIGDKAAFGADDLSAAKRIVAPPTPESARPENRRTLKRADGTMPELPLPAVKKEPA